MKLSTIFETHYTSSVSIVYNEHGQILFGKSKHNDDRNGKWCFPGGGIKPGECPGKAAERECNEETGYVIKQQQMSLPHPKKPWIAFVVCKKISGQPKPNNEFSELKWMSYSQILSANNIYYQNLKILAYLSLNKLLVNQ